MSTLFNSIGLPPDHSHVWHTDGLFSVIEGWLTHEGFAGCRTISELVTFLTTKFAAAEKYADQRVEIRVLIANFAFAHWFDGCIDITKLNNIGVPLVWSHSVGNASGDGVLNQYKIALSDEPSFMKDKWGPWDER